MGNGISASKTVLPQASGRGKGKTAQEKVSGMKRRGILGLIAQKNALINSKQA